MAQAISAARIVDWYEEAIDTDKKLPSAYRKGASAMQFDIVHDASDHAAWKKSEPKIVASAKQIARYEMLLFNINPLLTPIERKLVWSRALRVPYTHIGKKLKMHRHTVKEKYLETIIFIKYLIAYDKKLLDMIEKIT